MSKFRLETRPSVLIIFLRRQFTLYFHSFFYTTSQYIAPRTCWILMDSEQLFISKMQTDLLLLMIRCRSHDSTYFGNVIVRRSAGMAEWRNFQEWDVLQRKPLLPPPHHLDRSSPLPLPSARHHTSRTRSAAILRIVRPTKNIQTKYARVWSKRAEISEGSERGRI